jgi:hypothetical protein
MGNKIGIWMDSRTAVIVSLINGEAHIKEVHNNLDAYQHKEGSRGSAAWGPQDVGSEVKETERRKHQMKRYFDAIIEHVKNGEAIMVFGPAQTKDEFGKQWMQHQDLTGKLKAIETTDSMTPNQVIAHVKQFYRAQGSGS